VSRWPPLATRQSRSNEPGGNNPCSHTAAFGFNDSKGRPLSGEHRYTITFDLKDLPPVTEWPVPCRSSRRPAILRGTPGSAIASAFAALYACHPRPVNGYPT
jgi:hypothetical protein